ncbi:hypothetical protein TNCV_2419191 [Trichonephila clavipes]|nr:hypothetical protein TNCV_2419191 [Trichonephila clavipes]
MVGLTAPKLLMIQTKCGRPSRWRRQLEALFQQKIGTLGFTSLPFTAYQGNYQTTTRVSLFFQYKNDPVKKRIVIKRSGSNVKR